MRAQTIAPGELDRQRREGRTIDLIDVRTPIEYREIHAEGARSVPLNELDPCELMVGRAGDCSTAGPIYLICQSGSRSAQAAERFAQAGYQNAISVEGGTIGWERAGLPVVRGERTISLERQIRIAAGSLCVLGTLLGFLVHPGFFGVAGFVGAGLVFAGITDRCGMGLLLAYMPWNRPCASNVCKPIEEFHS